MVDAVNKVIPTITDITCKEALEDILNPPIASSQVEKVIRTGFLETPGLSPKQVVILAEAVPSWLAAADSWGAQKLSLYCEGKFHWYRENLDIMTPIQSFPTVAGLAKGNWLTEKNKIILVQGISSFCSKMVTGLESLVVTTNDKLILTCNGILRELKLSFKFLRLSHSCFGGCTDTVTSVGFSRGCGVMGQVELSTGISSLVKDHICPVNNGTSIDPSSIEGKSSKGISSMEHVTTAEFIVPSLFSKTNWVRRRLTDSEILSTLDSPVQITKAVNDRSIDSKLNQDKGLALSRIPLKTIQEVTRIFFDFNIPKAEQHTIPIYDIKRLGPTFTSGLLDIYSEIDQAKVAKSDDTKVNTDLWDEQASTCADNMLSEKAEFLVVNTDHRNLKAEKDTLFSFLRTCSHLRYKKNVRRGFNLHMKTTHGLEGIWKRRIRRF